MAVDGGFLHFRRVWRYVVLGCPQKSLASKLVHNLSREHTTYLYGVYNPVAKYQQDIPVFFVNFLSNETQILNVWYV